MNARHYLLLSEWLLSKFQTEVRTREKASGNYGPYTPHGAGHFQSVDESIDRIIEHQVQTGSATADNPVTEIADGAAITELERFVLRFCAWAHDVGMIKPVADEYLSHLRSRGHRVDDSFASVRRHHDDASAFFVAQTMKVILRQQVAKLDVEEGKGGAEVLQGHRTHFMESIHSTCTPDEASHIFSFIRNRDNRYQLESQIGTLASTVNLIASFHRRATDLASCPTQRYLFGTPIRPRLLAAIFRLADALQVDCSRVDASAYEAIRSQPYFTMESRLHWIKSFLVSAIRIEPSSMRINVQLDVPSEQSQAHRRAESERRVQMVSELRDFIQNDLQDELHSVTSILVRHKFPPLLEVHCHVNEVPAMDHEEDIWGVLEFLRASASPNTSQLIRDCLDSVKRLIHDAGHPESKTGTKTDPHSRVMDRVAECEKGISEQLKTRRCHEGLRKIQLMLAAVIRLFSEKESGAHSELLRLSKQGNLVQLLILFLDGVYNTFLEQRRQCETHIKDGAFDHVLQNYHGVVVYGYSGQALDLIVQLAKLRSAADAKLRSELPIHVLECRTKTLYTPTGQLLYHDGKRYATEIRRRIDGVHPLVKVLLMPDAQLGRILEDWNKSKPKKQLLVLLGSNAITNDGDLLHSMGHLSVAAIANSTTYSAFTDVVVVTDGLKIGATADDLVKQYHAQRNPDYWLSHLRSIRDELVFEGVEVSNLQEDAVPPRLIKQILVLDRLKDKVGLAIERNLDHQDLHSYKAEIAKAEFEPFGAFADAFRVRFVAARLRDCVGAGYRDNRALRREWKDLDLDNVSFRLAEEALTQTGIVCPIPEADSAEWRAIEAEAHSAVQLDTEPLMKHFCAFGNQIRAQDEVSHLSKSVGS